jgi:hypothetical protein
MAKRKFSFTYMPSTNVIEKVLKSNGEATARFHVPHLLHARHPVKPLPRA